ncbi:hypothetical protein FEDK69T_20260 [Flavobacterium enshiense DK69]|uniref:Uncharacterized protein n=1 Tax=Flavobacterium enshiense DK69 TaxID=1107311 RepID=V6SEE2_9FLAO|nr:hypothetical protein [Flavobacterium enshiense]ESU22765.1 hypothetical protein FEDK69T_20260 [Flavobacterium enshiense DK69]KGO95545.1 hypothetical protein Q767_09925 [Flavobacterium enshiense DK69]
MKKSIIYLGIALITFTNVISALGQQSHNNDGLTQIVQSNENVEGHVQGNDVTERNSNKAGNPVGIEPTTIEIPTYEKTITEIIAENNQIIENTIPFEETTEDYLANLSSDFYPLDNEKTMEDIILQDNQIIESPVVNYIQPIALEKPKK